MQLERARADSRNRVEPIDLSQQSIEVEMKNRRREARRRKDCYSLVQEDLSRNPFMTKIMKSSEFTPSAGVKHTDNIELANSPSIHGGDFKSPKNVMSKAEFELRTSLTILKQMGPEKGANRRNRKVTQSMEIKPYRQTDLSTAGKSFSNFTESRVGSAVRRLPKIKVFNKESIKDMIASLKDVQANKVIIDQTGPSPGAFTIA